MRAIVGLGNPGPKYAGTRHNVGFEVVHRLAALWGIRIKPSPCQSNSAQGVWGSQAVGLALPQTSMNASGRAVQCLLKRWKLERSEMLIVCDDVSLPLGTIRLRPQGSEGGHRGLSSILEELGTQEVPRLRVGIFGQEKEADLTDFVLGRFKSSERKLLEEGLELASQACQVWVARGMSTAMNQFNQRRKRGPV